MSPGLESFNCLQLVLSFSLAVSIHWFAQSYCEAINVTTTTMVRLLLLYLFWLAEICICHWLCPTRDETCDLQIAPPRMLMLPFFFFFFYASGTPHTRHICVRFELWSRPFCSSLLSSFLPSFWCCNERNSFHTALLSHFISLIRLAHHQFFIQLGTVAGFT